MLYFWYYRELKTRNLRAIKGNLVSKFFFECNLDSKSIYGYQECYDSVLSPLDLKKQHLYSILLIKLFKNAETNEFYFIDNWVIQFSCWYFICCRFSWYHSNGICFGNSYYNKGHSLAPVSLLLLYQNSFAFCLYYKRSKTKIHKKIPAISSLKCILNPHSLILTLIEVVCRQLYSN